MAEHGSMDGCLACQDVSVGVDWLVAPGVDCARSYECICIVVAARYQWILAGKLSLLPSLPPSPPPSLPLPLPPPPSLPPSQTHPLRTDSLCLSVRSSSVATFLTLLIRSLTCEPRRSRELLSTRSSIMSLITRVSSQSLCIPRWSEW